MKTDFSARPVYLRDENRIKAHFLICFLALMIYRFLVRKLNYKYTCEELLDTLKAMNFAEIQEQGFIPLYKREAITNDLHEACDFRTDYLFITKSRMKTIQKKVKEKNKLPCFVTMRKIATAQQIQGLQRFFLLQTVKDGILLLIRCTHKSILQTHYIQNIFCQLFTAPAVTPLTKCFWKSKNITISGKIAIRTLGKSVSHGLPY